MSESFSIPSFLYFYFDQFQTGKLEENEKEIASLRHTAYTYSTLIASIKELRHLRDLDSGEKLDPRDKIRATGGRVGLGVPKVNNLFYFLNYYFEHYYYIICHSYFKLSLICI